MEDVFQLDDGSFGFGENYGGYKTKEDAEEALKAYKQIVDMLFNPGKVKKVMTTLIINKK